MSVTMSPVTGGGLSLVPMTELEAMNLMLSSIGESEVSSVDSTVPEASLARRILHRVSRQVQSIGLHCNTDTRYEITLDGDDKAPVPASALVVDGYYKGEALVVRGGFLYRSEPENQTFEFDSNPYVDIIWFLDYENLPQPIRNYIAVRATRVFQGETIGAESLTGFTEFEERTAHMEMMTYESDIGEHNIFESFSVGNVIDRAYRNPVKLGRLR